MRQQIQNLIMEINEQINKLIDDAYNGDQSAIRLVKAYQKRVAALQMVQMELDGLGNTVMNNLLTKTEVKK